ncbi:MAG: type III-B CRISPR module RAMP protein Cmr4 [Anaerolineaceae bacterium]|nr:type III-B CRISPR module RAMP protein Cmr4 [Anaerolineaceae bacterium]
MKAKLLFLQALSPLHAGTGQGVGAIDLPVAREKATGIPIVPGSTIKGVLRSNCDEAQRAQIFGPETVDAGDFAGSAQFSDLRLLCLPVRSLSGIFAWVTSPLLLRRLQRDCSMARVPFPAEIPEVGEAAACLLPASGSRLATVIGAQENQVVLEDLRLAGRPDTALQALGDWIGMFLFPDDRNWTQIFVERLCLVHDDVLSFLLETATEIAARIRLEDAKKTVAEGALWYEESLPAETILSGLLAIQEIQADEQEITSTIADLARSPLQVGGNATVGRGLCQIRLVP